MKPDAIQETNKQKTLGKITVVLLLLLLIALAVAGALHLYLQFLAPDHLSAVAVPVPGNQIVGERESEPSDVGLQAESSVSIGTALAFRSSPQVEMAAGVAAQQFRKQGLSVSNLFPGDIAEESYTVSFKHEKALKVKLSFVPTGQVSTALLENLQVRIVVQDGDTLLCDTDLQRLVSDAQFFYIKETPAKKSTHTFAVTVSLPTTAGNDCANQRLSGDILWEAEEVEEIPPDDKVPIVTPPDTGDPPRLMFYLALAALAVAFIVMLLLWTKRPKKGDRHEK